MFQQRANLSVLQNALHDEPRLVGLVADADQLRLGAGSPIRPEVLRKTLGCQADHAVGRGKDVLCRAVVAVQSDDVGRRAELVRKIEDVAYRRCAERINRLRVVADYGESLPARL